MLSFLRKTALWILIIPAGLFGIGAASNQLVLCVNGDRFPVLLNEYKVARFAHAVPPSDEDADEDDVPLPPGQIDDTHIVMNSKTHLNFLADIIDLHDATYSIGDLLIMLGEWLGGFSFPIYVFVVSDKLRRTQNGNTSNNLNVR